MPLVSVEEISDGRTGKLTFDRHRQYVRKWRCVTDDDNDGPLSATNTGAFPTVGFPYITVNESDPFALVKEIDAQQDAQDPRLWIVTVTYDTHFDVQGGGGSGGAPGQQGGQSPAGRPDNPLNDPVRWSSDTVRIMKAVTTDKDGLTYKNSAGVPYNPPRELPKLMIAIQAVKNYASFPVSQQIAYWDKVNTSAWMGFAADTVKVDGIRIAEMYDRNSSYIQVSWAWLWDADKWIPTKILNKGYHKRVAGNLVAFTDDKGNATEELLNAAGDDKTTNATFKDYREFDRTSFAGIP